MSVSTNKLVAESGYCSLDHLVWLLGHANEAMIVVEGVEMASGIGGYWVPNLCPHLGILYRDGVEDPSTEEFERGCVASQGDGSISIPYKRYIEANLSILDLPRYNEDVLVLDVLDHNYGERVPVQIGTQVIEHLVVTMTEKEL